MLFPWEHNIPEYKFIWLDPDGVRIWTPEQVAGQQPVVLRKMFYMRHKRRINLKFENATIEKHAPRIDKALDRRFALVSKSFS